MPDNTIYRKDYQPPAFLVERVDLTFDLYDDHAMVSNQMVLKKQAEMALCLYGDELELISLSLDGQPLADSAYHFEEGNLIIPKTPDEFKLELVTRIKPQENSKLSGLYRSNQLFCTQCEAEGFRRITFFPDRPDVLAIYSTRIYADKTKYPVLLSNGNLMEAGEAADGRHWVQWQDPFKKPSYLFALVAGQLAMVEDEWITHSGNKVALRIYVEPGNEDKCSHAMHSLKKAMQWDEEVYGREYDLAIYMIVAVSDFNMGAMENKGLNIFNSQYILARPETATDLDFANIEGVVGHEYFHNWTGNRVTCRDWFQLSLKEGLTVFRDQEFSRDMNSRDVNRIQDVTALLNAQFPEDASSMAHPVRPESYQEINNFYTATIYNKGAEVIRMQETILGAASFRRGMDLYFQRHDGQAVTIDDFVAAMEDASGIDLGQFKRWYSQAGTPVVRVKTEYADQKLKLTLSQSCPPTPECEHKQPFHIPIRCALFDEAGRLLPLKQEVLQLQEAEQTFYFEELSSKPIVSLLRGFSAPVKLQQAQSSQELLALLRFETDGYAKWNAAQTLVRTCIDEVLHHKTQQIPTSLIDAFRHVLTDESLDLALRAEILTPPSFEEVIADLTRVDVDAVEKARDFFIIELSKQLEPEAKNMYEELWKREEHKMDAQAFAQRKLRNTCLRMMMKSDEANAIEYCQQQFTQAKTMTDQIASVAFFNNCHQATLRQQILERFYQQWSKNDLVVDKWFALQATSELPDTLLSVKALLQHPAFNWTNPNKVRALVGAFVQANPRHFHAADGSGYAFLTENLIKMDKINPQITARLATPFTRWRRYDETRQNLIKQALKQLATLKLSRDLNEVVIKSLHAESKGA